MRILLNPQKMEQIMRQPQMYGLFEKINGKWIRLYGCAYSKETAIRVYQNQLLTMSMNGREPGLRAVKDNGGV